MTLSKSAQRWLPLLASLIVFAGCERLSREERAILDDWLQCGHCDHGELAAVDSLAARKEKATVGALEDALRGPHPHGVDNLRHQYADSWRRSQAEGGEAIAETTYVRRFVENFVALYQKRSVLALGEIGTTRAAETLAAAAERDSSTGEYRDDVRRLLHAVLAESRFDPFGGGATPVVARFGDTVTVAATDAISWTGDEKVTIEGAPFPADVMVGTADAGTRTLRFVAAAPIGSYAVLVTDVGARRDTFWTPLRVVSYEGALHSPGAALDLQTSAARDRQYAPLGGRPARPMSTYHGPSSTYFRIEAPDATVRGVLEWTGNAQIVPLWYECEPTTILDSTSIQGTVIDARGDPIAGVTPHEPGVGSWEPSTTDGHFTLAGTPPYPIAWLPPSDGWRVILASWSAQPATGSVQGRVTDEDAGTPIAGARVSVQGTTLGARSNFEGYYRISDVPSGIQTVRAWQLGYTPLAVPGVRILAGEAAVLNFTLDARDFGGQALALGSLRDATSTEFTGVVDLGAVPRGTLDTVVVLHEAGRDSLATSSPDTFSVRLMRVPESEAIEDHCAALRLARLDAGGDRVVARLRVALVDPADSLRIEGSAAVTLAAGDLHDLEARAWSLTGDSIGDRPISWFSTDPAVARVSAAGEVTALGPGSSRVIATLEVLRDTVTVTVTP